MVVILVLLVVRVLRGLGRRLPGMLLTCNDLAGELCDLGLEQANLLLKESNTCFHSCKVEYYG